MLFTQIALDVDLHASSCYKTIPCHSSEDYNLISHLHGNLETYDITNTGHNVSSLLAAAHAH
jgi:hypothetical protein